MDWWFCYLIFLNAIKYGVLLKLRNVIIPQMESNTSKAATSGSSGRFCPRLRGLLWLAFWRSTCIDDTSGNISTPPVTSPTALPMSYYAGNRNVRHPWENHRREKNFVAKEHTTDVLGLGAISWTISNYWIKSFFERKRRLDGRQGKKR